MVMALSSTVLSGLLALPALCGGSPCECVWMAADNECTPDTEKAKNAVQDQKMKDYLDLATKAQVCEAMSQKTPCSESDGCSWDESETKCDVNAELGMQMMGMMQGEGGGLMGMIMKSMECSTFGESECGGAKDCDWDEGECSVSVEMAMGWLFSGPMGTLLPQMMQCQSLDAAACGDNDKCSLEEGTCDLAPAAAVELFMGDSPVAAMAMTSMECEALGTSSDCGANSDCAWTPDDGCQMGMAAQSRVMGMVGGYAAVEADVQGRALTCGGLATSGDCAGDSNCVWEQGIIPEIRRLSESLACMPQVQMAIQPDPERRLSEQAPPCECKLKSSVAMEVKGEWVQEEATCSETDVEGECTGNCTWVPTDVFSFCTINPLAGAEGSFAEFTQKAQACGSDQAQSGAACGATDGCLWENNTCDVDPEVYIKLMGLEGMPDGSNLMMKLATCSSFTSANSCNSNSDCTWENDSCGPSSQVWTQLLMGGDGDDVMAKCGKHPKNECSGDENCEFDDESQTCEPGFVGMMKAMFDEGADLDELLKRTTACMAATTESACSSKDCSTADGARLSAQHSHLLLLGIAFLPFWGKV